ncbi:unnamed protein product [Calypogeia fissa]
MSTLNLSATRPRDYAKGPGKLALHNLTVKYKYYGIPPDNERRPKPSTLVREKLDLPIPYRDGKTRLRPQIIESHNFFNLPYRVPSSVPDHEPLFQPFPPQITFTGYKAFNKYHAILQLRNNDKVVRRVMVLPLVSEILTVQPYSHPDLEKQTVYDELGTSRVACGMEFSVIVNWCPDNDNDFRSEVVVVTEREKFAVPVVCHGLRGVLDIVDEIHFPPTPVHYSHRKNVMLKNPGTRTVSFMLRPFMELEDGKEISGTFFVQPLRGGLEPGQFLELCLEFKPIRIGIYEAMLEVLYVNSLERVYSRLSATGIELDVGLSTDKLTMKPTFIRTSSELSVFFTNYSTEVARFQFERYATNEEEINHQNGHPAQENKAFDWAQQAADTDVPLDPNEDKDASALEKIFTLNPANGELWPGNRLEVIVTFSPQRARRYFTIAYCTVSGKQDRLELRLDGVGVGPLAQFFPTKVDLKELSLYSEYNLDVNLHNTGGLEAHFELETSRSANEGTIFRFDPENGSIPVGEIQKIRVTLFCNERVKFEEHFKWVIRDSVNFAPILFRGQIGNPSVVVEPLALDFGLVSYGFDCFRELRITNNSNVPLHFKLTLDELEVYMICPIHGPMKRIKIPYDCEHHGAESYFLITPALPTVPTKETIIIVVKFTPLDDKEYEGFISVYLEEIDEVIFKVSVGAECKIPKVTLPVDHLDYEKSYLRYEYSKPLELLNESQVPAKYKLLPLEVDALQLGDAFSRPREGIIEAFSIALVDILFIAYGLGPIEFSLLISICGKDPVFLTVKIKAEGIGAQLNFVVFSQNKISSSGENPTVDFGKVPVLREHHADIEITNISLIPAIFLIVQENTHNSAFRIGLDQATLQPQEKLNLRVTAFIDETLKFKDSIKITLEGGMYKIPCFARGFGSLLVCKEFDIGAIHLGDALTYAVLSSSITIQNLGRRTRQVTWTCADPKSGRKVFSVTPHRVELITKAAGSFLLSGMSPVAAKVEELQTFTGTIAASSAKPQDEPEVHNIMVDADIAHLALVCSPVSLIFVQMNGPGHEELDESLQTLTCQNMFKLELHGSLEAKLPFRLSTTDFCLQPMETMEVDVILDWQRPKDKLSHSFASKIVVHYRDTPRKDYVPLAAEVHFPNLQIEANKIEFGCVIENTSKRVQLKISNTSILEVQYCWAFIDKYGIDINTTSAGIQENDGYKIPTNQIFDILPIRGTLLPGEGETVEFSYFSFPKYKCRAMALCEVERGPSYSVVLDAESSAIKYTVNRYILDFGVQHFLHPVTSRMLSLTNESGVPFNFELDLSDVKRKGMLYIDPMIGRILSTEKQKFKVTAHARIPTKFVEHFKLQVEYFHPHDLEVRVEGMYPNITLDIQRVRSAKFLSFVETAWTHIHDSKLKGLVYPMKDSSEDSITEEKLKTMPEIRSRIQRHPSACVMTPATFSSGQSNDDDQSRPISPSNVTKEGVITINQETIPEKTPEELSQEEANKEAEEAARIEEEMKPTVEEVDVEIDHIMLLKHFYEPIPVEKKPEAIHGDSPQPIEPPELPPAQNISPRKNETKVLKANTGQNIEAEVGRVSAKLKGALKTSKTKHDALEPKADPKKTDVTEVDPEPLRQPVPMQEKLDVDIQKIVANKYVLDFENVRLGFAKKLTIRVSTGGYLPVTFKVDKSKAKGFGFSIEPDRVVNLPAGHSVPQTAELHITFNTNAPKFPVGRLECWVPINIKEGPITMVLLTANVTAPDLHLSTNSLDFETVLVGRCKGMFIRMENRGEAPCDWHSDRPEPGTVTMRVLKDWEFFTCIPNCGTIPPHDIMMVKVLFTPKLQKLKNSYETIMSLRVSGVTTSYVVNLKGRGYLVPLTFVPSFVDIGPVIPNSDVPAQAQVQLKNRSNQPVELYTLDFDPQYIQEEEILREAKGYNEKQILYLDVREAGEPFWKSLVEEAPTSPKGAGKGCKPSKEDDAKSKKGQGKKTDKEGKASTQAKSMINGPIVIIYGPPLIGKTTQAKKISHNLKTPIVDMENLMLSAVREKKLVFPGQDMSTTEGGKTNIKEVGKQAGKKDDPKKDAKKGKEKPEPVKKGEKPEKGGKKGQPVKRNFEVDLMNVLKTRLQDADCSAGVVFDGLRSVYVPPVTLIKCILEVLGLKSSVVNVPIPEDEPVVDNEVPHEEPKQTTQKVDTAKKEGKDKSGAKGGAKKTVPKNVWKGGPQVNFFLLKAEPLELATYLETVSEVCHSALKSKSEEEEEAEVATPPRLCQHHLHFPALEGGEQNRTEIGSHIHLASPSHYPYLSIFPTPEEVEGYFIAENELIKLLGGPTTKEEADQLGQSVILSPIKAIQEATLISDEMMTVLPTPASKLPVQEPTVQQIIKRPPVRELLDVTDFTYSIMSALPRKTPGSPKGDKKEKVAPKEKKEKVVALKKGGAPGKALQKSPLDMVPPGHEKKTRWVIPPKTSVGLTIQFWSSKVGEYDHAFEFEVMGTLGHHATLDCTGIAAYPRMTLYYMRFPPRRQNPNLIGVKEKRAPLLVPILEAGLDFGPINTAVPPKEYPELPDGDHCKKLSVKNTGLFDLHLDFELIPIVEEPPPGSPAETRGKKEKEKPQKKPQEPEKKAGKGEQKGAKKGDSNQALYTVHPAAMDLKIDQSLLLSLFCYPKEGVTGKVSSKLLCKIKNCPEPLEYTVTCVVDTPRVELNSNVLDFQRVLIGKKRQEELIIRNISVLKLHWYTVGIEKMPATFSMSQTSGGLKAGESGTVFVAFKGAAEEKLEQKLTLQVTHRKEDTAVAQEHQLRFLAEGYLMDVIITFPQPEPVDGIDFGTIKVAEAAVRPIALENKGKFPVKYRFNLSGQLIKEIFTIPTLEGTLAPKGKLKVDLHFNKEKTLKEETTLLRNCDISLDLIEPLYEKTEQTIPIYISLHAVHTQFLILPAREIDFEFQVCGLLSEARTMKILNTGVFDLEYTLLAAPVKESEGALDNKETSLATKKSAKTVASAKTNASSKTSASGKGGQGKKGKGAAAPKMLDLRGFQLFPSVGKLAPGMKQDISVYFKAPETPTKVYEEILITIKDRDPIKYPEDISYDLKGESQFPGFKTDPEVIFEEHRIVDNLEKFDTVLPPRTYAKGEHMYSFGAVYVDTDPPPTESELGPGKPSVKFSGEIHAVKVVGKSRRKGADVNFKFANPYKVACSVEFTLTPETVEQETLEAYEMPFAMEIRPMKIDIPPLECRYIQCLFTPVSIRTYAALFEAVVKNGGDDVRTKQFKCHLKGEGTLPHVQIEAPTEISPTGAPCLKYPRIKMNQSFTLPIILHNSGIVPATANILVGGGCDRWLQMTLKTDQMLYNVLPFSSSFQVRSKKRETILVTFTPLEIRQYECEIQVAVSSNPFNNLSILISGEGYLEDVECLGLPRQLSDTIWFEGGPYGIAQTIAFTLKNNCNLDWRFTWPSIPSLEFSPATGHLHARSNQEMIAVFNPTELTEHIDKDIRVPMYNIVFQEIRPLSQWDSPTPDTAMLEADQAALAKEQSKVKGGQKKGEDKGAKAKKGANQDGTKAGAEKAGKGKTGKKEPTTEPPPETLVELDLPPEPLHDVVPDTNKTMVLKLHAVADMIRYECSARSIHFKSTMMFQARTFSFSLKNLSRANLVFRWQMHMQDGQPDSGSLYAVSPDSGSLTAESSITVSVKFSPCEVEDCTRLLQCEIPGLDPQWMPLSLPVTGHVNRPWCHFKLPKSNYISGKRRSQALVGPDGDVGPLHPDMKVIEIKSLGINVQNFMTFTAVNPTSLVYKFLWEAITTPSQTWAEDEPLVQSALDKLEEPFRCLCKAGEINPGEGYEMNFEFCPLRYELQERFWTFRIPALDISVPFLLVGFVDKPKLHFDHAVVNFGKVQVGTKGESRILLVNREDTPFPFSFDKSTYLRTQFEQNPLDPVLLLLPQHGTLSGNSETPIDIKFMPMGEGPQNFNVVCNLKKSLQLTVNVKGEGYTIHDKVFLEVLNDGIPLQLSPKEVSLIDFGEILVNNIVFKRFKLTNTGLFPFQFVWMLGGHKEVVVDPPGGTVGSEEQLFCDLSFCPASPGIITNVMITCQIRHSNSYVLHLSGNAYRPKAVFSFLDYDFGPTFLDAPERDPPMVELIIRNAGISSITCENLYESTPHLDVPHETLLIPEGEKNSVWITFKPQAVKVYKEHVKFSINGLDNVTVLITGEGVGLDIQLKDPTQKNIIFDSLKIGQFAKIPVQLVNRSKAACPLSWAPLKPRFLELDMVCLPAEGLLLKAKATGTVDIQFRPKSRIAPFNEPFVIAAANTEIIIATVSGACTGTEVKLSVNKLAFATVTLGSTLTRKIQVENCGDIGTAFAWDVCTHATECTFFPPDGYLPPHQVATVEVSFHPTATHPDILIDRIPCVVTGGETKFLSLTGACIEHDPPVETLNFIAPVRSTDTKSLQIKNPTERLWLLTPKIDNKYFIGSCTVEVPPKGTVGYNINFCPLTMSNGKPHTGSITLPMPDGSALFYKLSGDAGAPLPAGDITFDVIARRKSSIPLQVENWLKLAQIFKVLIQQHVEDLTATLTGPKAVEIPGGAARECLLNFHAYRPGTYGYKVTFLNERTTEYIFYNIMVVVNKGDIVKTIPFECVVRQRMVHTLHVKNPLNAPVTFTVKCDSPEVRLPTTIEIDPAATAAIDIAYRPLLEVQKASYLILTNQLLGEMAYQLDLKCHAGGFDETLHFTAPLGSRQTQVFRFMHYLAAKANYKCELSAEGKEAGFIVPPSASADGADLDGKEAQVSIIFEPSVLGEKSSGLLYVQDPKAGNYTCRMLGTCVPPVPQGPVMLYGKAGSINFRNVFDTAIQFAYAVDNPAFVCSKGEKIPPKKQIKVSVSYKPTPGLSDRGRLTISSPEIPIHNWVFYLQGSNEPPPKAGKDGKGARKPSPTKASAKQK